MRPGSTPGGAFTFHQEKRAMHPPTKRRGRLQGILRDPSLRRELMVRVIVATQAREGIVTTAAQAEAAYDRVRETSGTRE